ncbi:hypothetical protein N9933_01415 [bacterium]|nr:hypothetical protein [bacterium]
MKWIFACILLLSINLGVLMAQDAPRLYINNTVMSDRTVNIEYDITYGGFVEIHLFDQENKKVWIYGVVNKKLGSYVFKIPTKPLNPGERYTYFFRYKGEEYSGSFYAS